MLQTCLYPFVHGIHTASCMFMQVKMCIYMYIHVRAPCTYEQCTYMFILAYVCTMYVHVTVSYMYVQYQNCTYMCDSPADTVTVHTFPEIVCTCMRGLRSIELDVALHTVFIHCMYTVCMYMFIPGG